MSMPRVRVALLWYDLWIGFYWDRRGKTLYFCPLPALVLELRFSKEEVEDANGQQGSRHAGQEQGR